MFMHRSLSRAWSVTGGIVACALVLGAVACPVALGGQAPAPSASLDQILKELSTYDGGIGSGAVWTLRDYVYARKDDAAGRAECEAKLLQFLKSPATPVAKMAAARHLRVIAGESAVPALQALLADERLADLAIYALQQIPGGVADGALIQAMNTATGATRAAVVTALGERKAAAAVPVIAPLLQQPALAAPAAIALGRIGGAAAASALVSAFATAPAGLKQVVASSILSCAETALAANDSAAALRLYETLSSDASLPVAVRKAALTGRITTGGKGAAARALEVLGGSDPDMQEAAIAKIADVFAPGEIGPICALMPGLSDRGKIQLLAVLSAYPGDRVAPTVMQTLASDAAAVRIAALQALGSVGGPGAVRPLADAASRGRGPEQAAARSALGMLKGRAVDDEIVAQLERTPPDGVIGELLLAVGDRRIFPAKAVVALALTSRSPKIRAQAMKALRAIGTPSDIPAVLNLLLEGRDESDRADAEMTTVALAQKIENPDGRSRTVKARLGTEKRTEARVRLIGVLPLIGDSSALPVLRALLEDADADVFDAAARAIAAWPTPAAREDLLRLARDSRNETHRLLAIGGLVRIVRVDKYRDTQAAVADLRQAAGFSWRPEEQKLVLGALAQFPCRDALELANGFLREPAVKAEAQAAINKITPRVTKEAIRK
jgi:HEAT repeat protein